MHNEIFILPFLSIPFKPSPPIQVRIPNVTFLVFLGQIYSSLGNALMVKQDQSQEDLSVYVFFIFILFLRYFILSSIRVVINLPHRHPSLTNRVLASMRSLKKVCVFFPVSFYSPFIA